MAKRNDLLYMPIDASKERDFFESKLNKLLIPRAKLSLFFADLLADKEFQDLDLQLIDLLRLTTVVLGEFSDIAKKIRNEKNDNK
jgi:hypothetical protein